MRGDIHKLSLRQWYSSLWKACMQYTSEETLAQGCWLKPERVVFFCNTVVNTGMRPPIYVMCKMARTEFTQEIYARRYPTERVDPGYGFCNIMSKVRADFPKLCKSHDLDLGCLVQWAWGRMNAADSMRLFHVFESYLSSLIPEEDLIYIPTRTEDHNPANRFD